MTNCKHMYIWNLIKNDYAAFKMGLLVERK